jgi:hypothetical protein
MSKGRRKRKREAKKQRRLPTIVQPAPPRPESSPRVKMAELSPKQTVFASKEILIAAPIEFCFGIIASQLEQPCQWDPILVNSQPVSDVRGKIGAISQVTLDLAGRKVESQAMISQYQPKRSISWVLNEKPKVREDWRLKRKPHGTMVHVTLAQELDGWFIKRCIYKFMHWKRVELDLGKMLIELKKVVESISQDQQQLIREVKS